MEGSLGVVGALNFSKRPVSSITRQSVKVPPTSTQTRFLPMAFAPKIIFVHKWIHFSSRCQRRQAASSKALLSSAANDVRARAKGAGPQASYFLVALKG